VLIRNSSFFLLFSKAKQFVHSKKKKLEKKTKYNISFMIQDEKKKSFDSKCTEKSMV